MMLKDLSFKHGVHPAGNKDLSSESPIIPMDGPEIQ